MPGDWGLPEHSTASGWQLGFQNVVGVDNIGRSGGLTLFWHDDWQVSLKSFDTGHIDTFITDDKGSTWRFTGFYGYPIRGHRNISWDLLRRIHSMFFPSLDYWR